jgi:protoporphyrinogen oxidase
VRRDRWDAIEAEPATQWLLRWCGQSVFDRLWKPLFQYKFYEYADNISSTWIWTRIRRIGRSRKSMMEEQLGYIEGGTITLVNALVEAIEAMGGRVHLGQPAMKVTSQDGRVTGVATADRFFPADHVISTAPTPYISGLIPDLPADWKAKYDAIHNIGCICVIFKLRKAVTPHFWVNISEPGLEIPGIIEFSNLRPFGDEHVVYVPYYMPTTHEKFTWSDEKLLGEALDCLRRINPSLTQAEVLDTKVARLRYAQPICEPEFLKKLPAVETPIAGLQVADTCYYYPEDRGVAESLRLGSTMAQKLGIVAPLGREPTREAATVQG